MSVPTAGTIAIVGDLIGPDRPVTPLRDSGAEAVFDVLRAADAAIGNHEGSAFDLDAFSGVRAAVNGGGYPLATPAATRDLAAMGISMVTKANNHALDWGKRGLRATTDELDRAEIAHAGSGINRATAQRPAYQETAAGRIALISLASTFVPIARVGEAGGAFAARPGMFAYRTRPVSIVTHDDFDVIRRIAAAQGVDDGELDSRAHFINGDILLGDEWFRAGSRPGLVYEPNARDHADVLTAVRFARQTADIVVVGVHAHETASGGAADRRPPAFLVDLYHDCVDEGADIAFTTGPHVVRGLEIYRGKPLFYGMASFFLELETGYGGDPDDTRGRGVVTNTRTAGEDFHDAIAVPESWYDGIVAEVDIIDGRLSGRIRPLRLTHSRDASIQGHPRLAEGDDARRVLDRFQRDSAALGTAITVTESIATFGGTPHS